MANDWQALADDDRKAGQPARTPIQWGDASLPGGGPLPRKNVNIHGKHEALGHKGNDVDIAVVGGLNASPRDEQRTIDLMRLALQHGAAELYFEGDLRKTFKTLLPPDVLDKVRRGAGETDHFHARWPVFRGNASPAP